MAKTPSHTPQEIEELIRAFEQSGLPRREFCEQQNLRLTTFDYYRTKRRKQRAGGPLMSVEIAGSATARRGNEGFILVLTNGRRLEMTWNYAEPLLARLIGIVEAA